MAKKKQIAVLGLGRFGRSVAMTLEEMGCEVLGVDKDENVIAQVSEKISRVVSFDIRDSRAFDQIGIENFDVVVIASKNLESSLMATMICEEKNIPQIIVKAIDERHAEMAQKLGATQIIFSERNTGRRLAMHLVSENVIDYIEIAADVKILSLNTPKKIVGKNLITSDLRKNFDVNVIAIMKNSEITVNPELTHTFEEDEKIFLLGTQIALANFEKEMIE